MVRGPCLFAATALALQLATTEAKAGAPAVALQLDCPALDDETRALLEARARAQIASETLPPGDVVIQCTSGAASGAATITWRPSGSAPRARTVSTAGAGAVDAVLEAMHELCAPASNATPPPKPPIPEPRPRRASPPAPSPPPESAPSGSAPRLAALVTLDAELWQGGIGEALGGAGGARLYVGRWRASLSVGAERGIGSAQGITAWGVRGVAEVDYAAMESLVLGLGLTARALWAQAATGTPTQQEGTTTGALVAIRYALRLGAFELAAGPRAEALLWPLVIHLNGSQVFQVPTFVVGATVEAAFPRSAPEAP